ncbi:MAG: hypothetical protein IJP42_11035 [Selenomonadaceae bacterium]|nr:hypothetical protein [Selenomonadaceae bacterium]
MKADLSFENDFGDLKTVLGAILSVKTENPAYGIFILGKKKPATLTGEILLSVKR